MYSALAAAFIEANIKHRGGPQADVTRIVIHGTVSPTQRGGARNVARYFQTASAGGSAHYVADPGEIIACVNEETIAAHAPPNTGSIGVELCDPVAGDGDRWADPDHIAMLGLTAELVRDIAGRWHVPLVWLSPENLRAGNRGITSHANVSAAWHRTDHTDPGPDFPVDGFMQLVRGGSSPIPVPPPQEDDVQGAFYIRKSAPDPKPVHLRTSARDVVHVEDFADIEQLWGKELGVKIVDYDGTDAVSVSTGTGDRKRTRKVHPVGDNYADALGLP